MEKKLISSFIFVLLLAAILLISGCSQKTAGTATEPKLVAQDVQQIKINTGENNQTASSTAANSAGNNIMIKDFAFSPAVLTIKKGDTVTWINEDSAPHKVASDPYPAHTDLPGLVSGALAQGDSYSFTFSQTGTFGYHCHLHPSMTGKVIVE